MTRISEGYERVMRRYPKTMARLHFHEKREKIGRDLHALYDAITDEEIPEDLKALLDRLR